MLSRPLIALILGVAAPLLCPVATAAPAPRNILLIAGSRSHGAGEHEFRAGCLLLQGCLNAIPGVHSEVVSNGWPASPDAFKGVDAVVIYSDGGDGHPAIRPERLQLLRGLMAKGVGLG